MNNQIFFYEQGKSGFDANALAFINAAGITDSTQKQAINTLVKGLKGANLYNKFNCIYPFVGGTANSHKYNLVDPRDLDIAFRLTYTGSITHSSTGMTPDGSTGYADTKHKPSVNMALSAGTLCIYSRTQSSANVIEIGSNDNNANNGYCIMNINNSGQFQTFLNSDTSATIVTTPNTLTQGLFMANRKTAGSVSLYKNGSLLTTVAKNSNALNTFNAFIGARNSNNTPLNFSNRELAFASIGASALTDTDATNYYNLIQAFQTTLGRQV